MHSQKPVCSNEHFNSFTAHVLISPCIEVSQVICPDSTRTFKLVPREPRVLLDVLVVWTPIDGFTAGLSVVVE